MAMFYYISAVVSESCVILMIARSVAPSFMLLNSFITFLIRLIPKVKQETSEGHEQDRAAHSWRCPLRHYLLSTDECIALQLHSVLCVFEHTCHCFASHDDGTRGPQEDLLQRRQRDRATKRSPGHGRCGAPLSFLYYGPSALLGALLVLHHLARWNAAESIFISRR